MAKGPRKRGYYAGWYAEIPRELKEEFVRIYPGRRSIRLFTVAFVSWAIKHRPDIEALNRKWTSENPKKKTQVEGDHSLQQVREQGDIYSQQEQTLPEVSEDE